MKITRAYIDEPKPEECAKCDYSWLQLTGENFCALGDKLCTLGAEDYAHCPLVYAPSRSVMRRLDIQMPLEDEVLSHVDATPDEYYPIRILEAHRQNCNSKWSSTVTLSGMDENNPLIIELNKASDKRAVLLDKAIDVLKSVTDIQMDDKGEQ